MWGDEGPERGRRTGDEAREERVKRLILSAVSRCGACRRRYTLENVAVVGHREHLWMVTVVCGDCRAQGFITAVIEHHDLAGPASSPLGRAPASDPTPAEAARPAAAPVSADDLLDLHTFLDDFDGDFTAIFAGERG